MRTRSGVPGAARPALIALAVSLLVTTALPGAAEACSCTRPPVHEVLLTTSLVAEVQLLDVGRAEGGSFGSQSLAYRIERVFQGPPGIAEGDLVWVQHSTCNSLPYTRAHIGARRIRFFDVRRRQLAHQYCSLSIDAWGPLPWPLVEARRRWLAGERRRR